MRLPIPKPGPATIALLGAPLLWLLVQLGLFTGYLSSSGALEYRRVEDTPSYLAAADIDSLPLALAQYRTIGYPAFLDLFRGDDGEIHLYRVPWAQWLLYAAAVLLLYVALARLSRSRWLAFVMATPLLYSPVLLLVDRVQPDFLASAAVLAAFAGLFLLLERRSWPRWLLLGVAVFASYQLRPAGMFLVALLPLVAALVGWICEPQAVRRALRLAAVVALVTVTPLLAFSALRWVLVGHFGLVSFGGSNAIGMASCFLEPQLVRELPPEHRPLAGSILQARNRRGYRPMGKGDDPRPFFEQYGPNVFSTAIAAAKAQIRKERREENPDGPRPPEELPPDWAVEANRRLGGLARQIVIRRPVHYLHWVRAAMIYGTDQLVRWPSVVWPAVLLLVSLPLALLRTPAMPVPPSAARTDRFRALVAFALSAIGYFATYLLTVSLVSFPFERYFLSMLLLLPSLLLALLFETCRRLIVPSAVLGGRAEAHSHRDESPV